MKDRIKDIFKIKFIQDVGSLQISRAVIAATATAASLIIAKGLKPTDFGIYSLILSLYCLVSAFGNLGVKQTTLVKLSSAYINQDKEEAISVLAYYFKISLLISLLIMTAGCVIAPHLSGLLYGRQDIGRLSRMLFLMLPLIILYRLVTVILESTRHMKYLAIAESATQLIQSLILIVLVSLGLGLAALLYGWIFSAIISSILAVFLYNSSGLTEKTLPSISEIIKKSYSADNRRFLRLNLSMGLSENIINLNDNLPIIFLGVFVLPKEVGYFKLGYSIMGLSALFLGPIARNLLVKLRQLQASGDIKKLSEVFYRISLFAGVLSAILGAVFIAGYHSLIYFFLKDYRPSLGVIYILAVYFCIAGFGIGLSPVLRALERLDIEIKINALGVLIFTILAICLTKSLGISGMAAALAFSAFFVKFIMYLLVRKELNKLVV